MRMMLLLIAPFIVAACTYTPPEEPAASALDGRKMKFVCEPYGENEWSWKLVGGNNEIVGISEGFKTKQGCYRAAETAKKGAAGAVIERDTD